MAVSRNRRRPRGGLRPSSSTGVGSYSRVKQKAPPRAKPKAPPRPKAPVVSTPAKPIPTAAQVNTTPIALSGGVGGYDMGADPAVAAAAGISAKIRAQAQAQALAKRKQAAIEYGDPTGVAGVDETTAKAARENPYSVVKTLDRNYKTGVEGLDEDLNQANLFYSGYRAKQLGDAAHAYGQSKYTAANNYRSLLTDINDRLADSMLQADMYDAQAALASSGGGYGSGGGDPDPGYDDGVRYASNLGALSGRFGPIGTGTVKPVQRPAAAPKPPVRYPALSSGFNKGRPVRGGY